MGEGERSGGIDESEKPDDPTPWEDTIRERQVGRGERVSKVNGVDKARIQP